MKQAQTRLKHGLAWVAAIFLLTWLFLQAQGIGQAEHQEILRDLGTINLLDGGIEEEILKLRYQMALNYDPLNDKIDHLRDRVADMRLDMDKIGASPASLRATRGMETVLRERVRLIEQLKGGIAILKNALAYFPLQVRHYQAAHGGDTTIDSEELLRATLTYNVTPTSANRAALTQAGDRLSAAARNTKATSAPRRLALEELATRYADILATGEAVNRQLLKLTDRPTPVAQALTTAYLKDVELRSVQAQRYRVMLFVAALLLLLYALSVFVSLREKTWPCKTPWAT
jgi:hypothetical protein